MSGPLRRVIGVRVENYLRRVEYLRRNGAHASVLGVQRHRSRRARVFLECGHETERPFRRGIRELKHARCEACAAAGA